MNNQGFQSGQRSNPIDIELKVVFAGSDRGSSLDDGLETDVEFEST